MNQTSNQSLLLVSGDPRESLHAYFIIQAIILIGSHLYFVYRNQYGRHFYFDKGYVLIVVATFVLGGSAYGVAFDAHPCTSPVGYCGTISCVSGNILIYGYIFMFVIFLLNALIYLQSFNEFREQLNDEEENNAEHEMVDSGRGHSNGSQKHHIPKRIVWACYDAKTNTVCPPMLNCREALTEVWSLNRVLLDLLRIGLILTTLTGILPTIAYDDPDEHTNLKLIGDIHSVGIVLGSTLIILPLLIRTICRIVNDIIFDLNRSDKGLRIFIRIEYIWDLIIFGINIAQIGWFGRNHPPSIPASWYCLNYKTEISCEARDRALNELITPWPCQWTNQTTYSTLCADPNCNYPENAAGIITEYFLLAFVMLLISSYMTSVTGNYSRRPDKAMCCTKMAEDN